MNTQRGGRAAAVAGAMLVGAWSASAQTTTNAPASDPVAEPMAAIEDAVQRIRGSYDAIRTQFEETRRQLRQAQTARQALDLKRRELESKLDAAAEETAQLRAQNQRLEADLADARQRVTEALRTASEIEERWAAADRDVRRLTRERDDALSALERERLRSDAAEQNLARLKSAMAALERQFRSVPLGRESSSAPAQPAAERPAADAAGPGEPMEEPVRAPAHPAVVPPHMTLSVLPIPLPEPSARSLAVPGATDPEAAPEAKAGGLTVPRPVLEAPGASATNAMPADVAPADASRASEGAVDDLIASAAAAADAGQWREAVALSEEALRRRPSDVRARAALVQSLQGLGQTEEAWRQAQALLADAPRSPHRLFLAGRAAALARHSAKAVELLEQAAELAPNRADIARELGAARFDAGRPDPAAEAFQRAVQIDPTDGESWFNAAVCILKSPSPNLEKAAEMYRKAIELGEQRDERIEQRLGALAPTAP